MPDISGNSCTAPFNSACCASPRAGGNLRTARKSRPQARPRRRRQPTVRWCGDPVPEHPPWLKPSSPGPIARWRANAPFPEVSAPESAAGANPWHPYAIVAGTCLSPSHPSPTLLRPLDKLAYFHHKFTLSPCTFHLGFGLGSVTKISREVAAYEPTCGDESRLSSHPLGITPAAKPRAATSCP